jgi:hypothetical protein
VVDTAQAIDGHLGLGRVTVCDEDVALVGQLDGLLLAVVALSVVATVGKVVVLVKGGLLCTLGVGHVDLLNCVINTELTKEMLDLAAGYGVLEVPS